MTKNSCGSSADSVNSREEELCVPPLIISYLIHHCHGDAARAFLSQWQNSHDENQRQERALATLETRHQLMQLIVEGQVMEAIESLAASFPDFKHDHLMFRLWSQHFIELLRVKDWEVALSLVQDKLVPLTQADSCVLEPLLNVIFLSLGNCSAARLRKSTHLSLGASSKSRATK